MVDDLKPSPNSPEVEAAANKMKQSVAWETMSTAAAGGIFAGTLAFFRTTKNKIIGGVVATGALLGGLLGRAAAKAQNKHIDDIVNNPDSVERDKQLRRERQSVSFETGAGIVGGGVGGTIALWHAPEYLEKACKNIPKGGKIAIIATGTAIGAAIMGGIGHHLATKQNRKVDALTEALNKQPPASQVAKLDQQQANAAAQAQAL